MSARPTSSSLAYGRRSRRCRCGSLPTRVHAGSCGSTRSRCWSGRGSSRTSPSCRARCARRQVRLENVVHDKPSSRIARRGVAASSSSREAPAHGTVRVPADRATGRVPRNRTDGSTLGLVDTKKEIREFLTSRRARITPEQAGLRSYGSRRVPGLRREEVAVLAGVSVPYYTRLERGDMSGASQSVLEALARALGLDDAERAHLFDLAARTADGSAASSPPGQATRPARGPVDTRRDYRRRCLRRQPASRHPGRQPARARAVLRAVRRTRAAGQQRPVRLPRSASRDVLSRLGARRRRVRRNPALERGP